MTDNFVIAKKYEENKRLRVKIKQLEAKIKQLEIDLKRGKCQKCGDTMGEHQDSSTCPMCKDNVCYYCCKTIWNYKLGVCRDCTLCKECENPMEYLPQEGNGICEYCLDYGDFAPQRDECE